MINRIYFAILSLCFCGFISCRTNCKSFYIKTVKEASIEGVVEGKYINYNNHGNPAIKLKDSLGDVEDYVPFCFYKLYETVQQNDSLYKPSGSLEYRIYRKDTVIKLYPVIDGDTLR